VDIANGTPPALRPPSLPDMMTLFWNLLESCWAVDPTGRPTADRVMHTHRRWHDDYENDLLKQGSPIQDIADYFLESFPTDENIANFEAESSDEKVSTDFETTSIMVL
jgi:hypothetical protein